MITLNKRPKVYFSKSNQCNPQTVMMVRAYLDTFNVEVLEFKGGTYSHADVIKSDYLLVLKSDLSDSSIIGKGQYSQIEAFLDHGHLEEKIFIVNDLNVSEGFITNIYVSNYEGMVIRDSTNFTNHAFLISDLSMMSFSTYFDKKEAVLSKTPSNDTDRFFDDDDDDDYGDVKPKTRPAKKESYQADGYKLSTAQKFVEHRSYETDLLLASTYKG